MTIRKYFNERSHRPGDIDVCDVAGWDGWTIQLHNHGLTLCSPGTSPEQLNYRDDSEATLRFTHALEITWLDGQTANFQSDE